MDSDIFQKRNCNARAKSTFSGADADCGEVDEGEKVVCPSVISRGEAAEVVKLVEAALDAVT